MKHLIRNFDRFLRWAFGVFEFCAGPDCLLRVRRMSLSHPVTLAGQTYGAGTPAIELHLWNEHLPPLPPEGATLAWAVQTRRRLAKSFRALATHMSRDPRLADARLVGGITVLPLAGAHAGGVKLFEQLGFTILPYHGPLGRFGEFWENLYTWGVMWAFNAPTLTGRRLLGLRRSEVWMTTEELLRRYGDGPEPKKGA
ncbi:MAG: YkoP family protein [Anaerolineae bacterium]